MTICLETTIQRWNGADGEQMNITDVPEGSRFRAINKGKRYIFHDGGWTEDLELIYAIQAAAL